MKKFLVGLVVLGLVFTGGSGVALADLLYDRGLPTDNLNNAAGVNRSNVAWAFGSDTYGQWLAGDDFTLGGIGNYNVDTISVWSTSSTGSLWFGEAGGMINNLGTAALSMQVTYSNGENYQGSSGAWLNLYQLNFGINQVLSGATTYQFFLGGPITGTSYAFLHSSNAALSGSTQQGSNNYMLAASVSNGVLSNVEQWKSSAPGNGWDKDSDGNVRVSGTAVPEPATILLLGLGLVGLTGAKRKFKK